MRAGGEVAEQFRSALVQKDSSDWCNLNQQINAKQKPLKSEHYVVDEAAPESQFVMPGIFARPFRQHLQPFRPVLLQQHPLPRPFWSIPRQFVMGDLQTDKFGAIAVTVFV